MKKIHDFDEVFDAQKMFRLILDTMANPTRTMSIRTYSDKLFGNHPSFLALAMTLLDNEVSFNACDNEELADEIVSLTLSRIEPVENADFIFVPGFSKLSDAIENAKGGTLRDPHKSATVILRADTKRDRTIRLCGPGIKGYLEFEAPKAVLDALKLRDNRFDEYPCGIDLIFVSDSGGLFAIPRLVREAN